MHACNKHTSTRVSTHALRRETINTRRQRSNERCNDISSFSLFTFLTLAPVMCVVFLFTSSGCCYRERHSLTGGKFTERVLPGPCTVHRDQILPRCIMCVCVCVDITLYSPPLELQQPQPLFYRAQDLCVPSEFCLYELQLIPRLVEKTRAERAFIALLGKTQRRNVLRS